MCLHGSQLSGQNLCAALPFYTILCQRVYKLWLAALRQNCGSNSTPQGPRSQILMTGRSDRGSYFIPQKITTSEFVYPKKSLSPLSQPQKTPLFFFATKKNPGVFHRPKNITFGQNFRPKKITRTPPPPPVIRICEWSLWVQYSGYQRYGSLLAALNLPCCENWEWG